MTTQTTVAIVIAVSAATLPSLLNAPKPAAALEAVGVGNSQVQQSRVKAEHVKGPELVAKFAPGLPRHHLLRIVYISPDSVDSGGVAYMAGSKKGPRSKPTSTQSRLDVFVNVTNPNKVHHLECEVSKQPGDIQRGEYEFRLGGTKGEIVKRSLIGAGKILASFTPRRPGPFYVFLTMTSQGSWSLKAISLYK